MPDILKVILDELPKVVSSATFEGANIVLYTGDKSFFLKSDEKIRGLVNKLKKRVELRASKEILLSEEETKKEINKLIPKEAEVDNILFDDARSSVVVEVKKPGLAIGKGGEILKTIKEKTFWTPTIMRIPAIKSKITTAIRHTLFENVSYRKKFLNSIGKQIYTEWSPEKKDEWVRLGFLGGGRQVGRSCLLLQTPESKILLDCGIDIAASNSDKFPILNVPEFDIKELDAIIISHAHLDHSGLVPYLYKLGYKGPCYMTAPTRDIAALLALDFIGVSYKKAESPLFKIADVKTMIKHSIALDFNVVTDITPDVRLTLYNAGHCLGSSMIHLNIGNGLHNLLYTADFKFARSRVLDLAANKFPRLETLICESTYGGKQNIFMSRKETEDILIDTINKTLERKGKALVPVLGVGRAQEIMMVIDAAIKEGRIKKNVPVYIDGMVWDITAIHTAYPNFLSSYLKTQVFQDKNPFLSERFNHVGSAKERQEVIEGGPCIILATSGMLVGGASVEYLKNLADNKNNSLIIVSYQGHGSLGRQIQEGVKELTFEGEKDEIVPIKLEVKSIDSFSAHAGRKELLGFVNNLNPSPRRIIVNHGEPSRSLDLASSFYKIYKVETSVPRNLDIIRIR
ncbi:MAG: beta-CASP ribonuclease aCPSF1 [archaeon]|nr:MAG: beta-CASP ribonuclease aCPSF1 [archaeon]